MSDSSRIDELVRRVQRDPASIAFAALAEEYRRVGQFDAAIETSRAGLQRHPAYVSARVTLGRALLELGQYEEAERELEHVLRVAPENLAAIRGLAELHHRRGEVPESVEPFTPDAGSADAAATPAGNAAVPPAQAMSPGTDAALPADVTSSTAEAGTPEETIPEASEPPPPAVAAAAPALPPLAVSVMAPEEPLQAPVPAAALDGRSSGGWHAPGRSREAPAAARAAATAPVRAESATAVAERPADEGLLPALEAFLAAIEQAKDDLTKR